MSSFLDLFLFIFDPATIPARVQRKQAESFSVQTDEIQH